MNLGSKVLSVYRRLWAIARQEVATAIGRLVTVATSGSYDDLSNKPTIPASQVQTDWNATTGIGVLLNKPNNLQTTSNLVTSLSPSSTDAQYPSAKCVYDTVGDIESALAAINGTSSSS